MKLSAVRILLGLALALMFFLVSAAYAEDWQAEALRLRTATTATSEQAVYQNLIARMKATLEAVPRARTRAEADAARPRLRQQLKRSLGFEKLPVSPDLHARITSTVRKNGYRIENLVYEALPGEWIPANLYVRSPSTAGRRPFFSTTGTGIPTAKPVLMRRLSVSTWPNSASLC